MSIRYILVLLAWLVAGPASALCPEAQDDAETRLQLMAALRVAPDPATAQQLSAQLWQLWLTAPDAHAQDLLDEGMDRREAFDFSGAIVAFDALIAYCPAYAEGYNQRAFARFLQQDYGAALLDLDEALARRPDHIGALSGRALTLLGLDRETEAQRVLREALALNPWLPERRLLRVPPGQDL